MPVSAAARARIVFDSERGCIALSSVSYGLFYPLWAHDATDTDLLTRVTGDVGIDHLTIPVVTGAHTAMHFCPLVQSNLFATEGGWHYPPHREHYRATDAKVRVARWSGSRNMLERVCRAAEHASVPTVFRVNLRAIPLVTDHERHLRMQNAWGDDLAFGGLCPLNPEVQELLHSVMQDLQPYGPDGFELVDWCCDQPILSGVDRPGTWHPDLELALETCFCPACRQVAVMGGVDADAAARSARVHAGRMAAQERPADHSEPSVPDDDILWEYRQVRQHELVNWLERCAESTASDRLYLLHDSGHLPHFDAPGWQPLVRVGGTLLDGTSAELLAELEEEVIGALSLWSWQPQFKESSDLVRTVSEAVELGVQFFDFEGFECAPEEAVQWLRQAVRYARRG